MARTTADPWVIFWRVTRHIYQFLPYLLFAVFAYSIRILIQTRDFYALQYLGVSPISWFKMAVYIVLGLFFSFYFILTPLQRLALENSKKPMQTIQSVLLAPTGLWFLEKTDCHTLKFIKARSYDQKSHALKQSMILTIQNSNTPQLTVKNVMNHSFQYLTEGISVHDYFPFVDTQQKIQSLKRLGFSTIDYQVFMHNAWFLPLYWFGLAVLAFLIAYFITSTIYFFLIVFAAAIGLFFIYEMILSFILAEKIPVILSYVSLLMGLYSFCGGWYVGSNRYCRN